MTSGIAKVSLPKPFRPWCPNCHRSDCDAQHALDEHLWAIRTIRKQQEYAAAAAVAPVQGPKPRKQDPKIPLRRGKWEFHWVTVSDGRQVKAWQYDGMDYWLRPKEDFDSICTMHWSDRKRPRRWYRHDTPPETWILKQPRYWYWRKDHPDRKFLGYCTHHRFLDEAMKVAEEHIAEQVMKALSHREDDSHVRNA